MKTMILAAAAVLSLGVGSAFAADGPGGTFVQAQWDRMNGINSALVHEYYGSNQAKPTQVKQHSAVAPQREARSNVDQQGAYWNSNG